MLSKRELGLMADTFPFAAAAAGERDWAVDFAIAAANQRAERDAAEKRAQAAQMVELVEDRAAEVGLASQTHPRWLLFSAQLSIVRQKCTNSVWPNLHAQSWGQPGAPLAASSCTAVSCRLSKLPMHMRLVCRPKRSA